MRMSIPLLVVALVFLSTALAKAGRRFYRGRRPPAPLGDAGRLIGAMMAGTDSVRGQTLSRRVNAEEKHRLFQSPGRGRVGRRQPQWRRKGSAAEFDHGVRS